MRKIGKLILANCRKDKKQILPFFLILFASGVLLSLGIILMRYRGLYYARLEQYHTPDLFYQEIGDSEGVMQNIKPNDYIGQITHYEAIYGEAELTKAENGKKESCSLSCYDRSRRGELEDICLLEQAQTPYENGVFLSDYITAKLGISLGDEVRLQLGELEERTYRLEGIYEGFYANSYFVYNGWCYLRHEDYEALKKEALERQAKDAGERYLVVNSLVNFKEGLEQYQCVSRYNKEIAAYTTQLGGRNWGMSIGEIEDALLIMPNIVAVLCCSIAIVVAMICIIVTGFVISNNIKRDIKNIGALKAIGYTGRMIRMATMLEFALVSLAAALAGIGTAVLFFPKVEEMLRPMVGLRMTQGYCTWQLSLTALFLTGLSIIVTLIATKKIGSIKPMIALRFGLESHSYRKNPIPLAGRGGNLHVLLALKTTLQNAGHNVVLLLVSTAIAFVMLYSCILLYNTAVDRTAFVRLLMGDTPELTVEFEESVYKDKAAIQAREQELLAIEGIREVNRTNGRYVTVKDQTAYLIGCDHVERMDCGLCEGSMPQRDNEVVIGTMLAKRGNIRIGDEICVNLGEVSKRFVVSGMQQCFYGMGSRIYLSMENFEYFVPDTGAAGFRLKVTNRSAKGVEEVIERLRAKYGDTIVELSNEYEENYGSGNLPLTAVRSITIVLVLLALGICLLVINILIKTELVNKQKEFGIKKAIGFTSLQLRVQMALTISPVIVCGAFVGSILGYLYGNRLCAVLCQSYAIQDLGFIRRPEMVPVVAVCLTGYAFLLAYLMSARIKMISAYQLIVE